MAVRQYVGARYVPKFADPVAWQANTAYEALTIVTYNNSSYTSKVPVPATVGNPADNDTYWALTGNYNAQVEDYRQTTENYKQEVDNNIPQIQTNANNITALQSRVADIEDVIIPLKGHTVIFVGDSYNDPANGSSWGAIASSWLENKTTAYNFYSSGCHFYHNQTETDNSFLNLLKNNSSQVTDKNAVTDIVIMGGANDTGALNASPSIPQSIALTWNYIHETFPNAKLHIGFCSSMMTRNVQQAWVDLQNKYLLVEEQYKFGAAKVGAHYMANLMFVLNRKAYFNKDLKTYDTQLVFHPNQLGNTYLAYDMLTAMYGNFEQHTISSQDNIYAQQDNNNIKIYISSSNPYYNFNVSFTEMAADTPVLFLETNDNMLLIGNYYYNNGALIHTIVSHDSIERSAQDMVITAYQDGLYLISPVAYSNITAITLVPFSLELTMN